MNPTHYCFCELAPLYVLDLLNKDERDWVEAQLIETPELAEELVQYQVAATALPYGIEPMEVDPGLKGRLFDRLELDPLQDCASVTEPVSPNDDTFSSIRFQDIAWQSHPVPGVEISIFYTDLASRRTSGILKASPGMKYPLHRHGGVEEIYMISGDLTIGNEKYGAGDYIRSHPGSIHNPHSRDGCLFFFNTSMDDKYFETADELHSLA
jgi:ChrR Cupin-like domain